MVNFYPARDVASKVAEAVINNIDIGMDIVPHIVRIAIIMLL